MPDMQTQEAEKGYVWVIGGGIMQVPMVEEAHRRGYKVIVSDRDNHCVAKDQSDLFLCLDTYDTEAHVSMASKMSAQFNGEHHVKAVVGPGVDVGPTVSAVAEALHLPTIPYQTAYNVRNKAMMRSLLFYDHPRYHIALGVYPKLMRDWGRYWFHPEDAYPCVVKPVDNCGSRGVSIVHSPEEMLPAISLALGSRKATSGAIIEELLTGPEYALDFLIINGEARWLNGVRRYFRSHIPGTRIPLFGIEAAIVNPWSPPQEVIDLATESAYRLKVTSGSFKMDVINDPRYGWCVLECATRLSGGYDHMYLGPMVGKDITGVLLDDALGLPLDEAKLQWNGKYAASYNPYFAPGKISVWERDNADDDSLDNMRWFIRSGIEIPNLKNCADRPIFVPASGDSPLSALRTAWRFARHIKPMYI